ncbi:LLM class flavin-dependent oxidoreductase [Streptomyces sp. NPDC058000]|uniref:LLM class flavin-dependent oxidoreductase n=1 Tax=Streptomyces sp. NPDC058000 TaxID=3346299 RepID=UPI0036ECE7E5
MPVSFVGSAMTNDGSETRAHSGPVFDKEYTLRLAQAHEEAGWDRLLIAYRSNWPDPAQIAAYLAANTDHIEFLVAHRPNVSYPTFAATTFATFDHVTDGRLTLHFISGAFDDDQQREGDFLKKDERYARTREYMQIVKKAWTSHEPFDYEGEHYRFHDFVSDVFPAQQPRPALSFGGSSPAAYAVGGAEADIYGLWAESLAGTAEQINSVYRAAQAAGRTEMPRLHCAFRPILGATEEQAWEKAHRVVDQIHARKQGLSKSADVASYRLRQLAAQGERFDRCLWTGTVAATGGGGPVAALVGTPETVAAALLDYVDLGVEIIAAHGYDYLEDAVEFGREVIPIVRAEVAKRDALRQKAADASAPAADAAGLRPVGG